MKILKIAVSAILVFLTAVLPFKLYGALNSDIITDEMYRRREAYFHGVINVWQIDCFEGGTGSRASWLKSICGGFEKKNNGIYINIESVSLETANKMLESGQKVPDMISFGNGVKIDEQQLEQLDFRGYLKKIENACFGCALPWCMGAYFMLGEGESESWGSDGYEKTGKKSKTVYSVGIAKKEGYNSAKVLTLLKKGDFSKTLSIKIGSAQEIFESYNYSQTVNRMLGTQRDIYRLISAQSREKARSLNAQYLGIYTDLFQYISILKCNNEKKLKAMQAFTEYLLSVEVQNRLGEIGLFPVNFEAEPEYGNEYMSDAWQKMKIEDFVAEGIFSQEGDFDSDIAALENNQQ